MTDRKGLSSLADALRPKGVRLARDKDDPRFLAFSVEGPFGRKVLCTVSPDDLFDQHGNHFVDNLA